MTTLLVTTCSIFLNVHIPLVDRGVFVSILLVRPPVGQGKTNTECRLLSPYFSQTL